MLSNSLRIHRAKRLARRGVALLAVFSLALPATALAVGTRWSGPGEVGEQEPVADRAATETKSRASSSGQGSQEPAGDTQMAQNRLSEQRKLQLKQRVRDRLRERKASFDRAVQVLTDRIASIEQLASRVEGAGGDVGTVYVLLDEARALVERAIALEQEAAALFNSIAESDDPRAAFEEARDTAIAAVKALRDARAKVRAAVLELLEVIDGLLAG